MGAGQSPGSTWGPVHPSVSPAVPGGSRAAFTPLWKMFHRWCWLSVLGVPCTRALVSLGVVFWCLQRRERETRAAAADPPSERATRAPFHSEGKGPFPICGRCPFLGTELFQEHKDQGPPQGPVPPGFTGVPPATVVLQDKWALAHGADVRVTFLASWLVHRESSLL